MNKELGEIFKALKANALKVNDCINVKYFISDFECDFTCRTCPLFQTNSRNYIGNVIITVEVLNEPRTDRDS